MANIERDLMLRTLHDSCDPEDAERIMAAIDAADVDEKTKAARAEVLQSALNALDGIDDMPERVRDAIEENLRATFKD
jgi:hypothetical protein